MIMKNGLHDGKKPMSPIRQYHPIVNLCALHFWKERVKDTERHKWDRLPFDFFFKGKQKVLCNVTHIRAPLYGIRQESQH